MSLRVHVLGDVRVLDAAGTQRPALDRRFGLLAYLACANEAVERDKLATLFWPEVPTTRARTNLRSLLARVRRLPYASDVLATPDRVTWRIDCDVRLFRRAVDHQEWDGAVAAYGGELLPGAAFDGVGEFGVWLVEERERLRSDFRRAALARCDELDGGEEPNTVARLLERLLQDDPYDEEVLRRAVRSLAAAGQRDRALRLGRDFGERLERELGATPTEVTERLLREVDAAAPHEDAAPITLARSRSEPAWAPAPLPTPLTRFVGRERERKEVAQRLERPDCRLVTLTGTGGVGKTRLALQVAVDRAEAYRDGAHFVALGSARSSLDVAIGIAETLGLRLPGDAEVEEVLAQALAEREALLVLDDVDGVLCARALLLQLLTAAPRLDLLVTSRERLDLGEEWLVRVSGLDHPPPDAPPEAAFGTDAGRLFLDAAQRVDPDFPADEQVLQHVVRICRLVEGLPLGMELAAAWVRSMPISDLADELEVGLDLLRRAPRHDGDRHHSVRAVFEHSWTRLSAVEAETLAGLGVFRGGFRREAASEVVGATLPALAALADKSLLRLARDGRYGTHPLVEQFARVKLAERPEVAERARRRHRAYYAAWSESVRERFERHGEPQVGDWVAAEYANLMAVFEAAADDGEAEEAARVVTSLAWFWAWRGRLREGRLRLERVLELPFPDGSVVRAEVMTRLAAILSVQGEVARARALQERASCIIGTHGDAAVPARVRALQSLGSRLLLDGHHEEAAARYEEGLALATEDHHVLERLGLLSDLGHVATRMGRERRARAALDEAMDLARRHENEKFMAVVHVQLGRLERQLGRPRPSREHLDTGLAKLRVARHAPFIAGACFYRGLAAVAEGDLAGARPLLAEALTLWWESGSFGRIADALRAVAALRAAEADPEGAGLLWGASEALAATSLALLLPSESAALDEALDRARSADPEAFAAGAEVGRAAERAASVAYARRVLVERAEALPAD